MAGDFSQFLMVLGIFAGAVVSGLTGFAFSAVAGALLLHVLPPSEAVPLMMVCSVLVQSASLVSLWRHIQWRQSVAARCRRTFRVTACTVRAAACRPGLVSHGLRHFSNCLCGLHAFSSGRSLFQACGSTSLRRRDRLSGRIDWRRDGDARCRTHDLVRFAWPRQGPPERPGPAVYHRDATCRACVPRDSTEAAPSIDQPRSVFPGATWRGHYRRPGVVRQGE